MSFGGVLVLEAGAAKENEEKANRPIIAIAVERMALIQNSCVE
jgi:hypothetical protein